MADIRINSLPTTASASSSDDFLALDGATNGTRKLNAYSPTFGGNLTVSGTGTSSFSGSLSVAGQASTINNSTLVMDFNTSGDYGRLLAKNSGGAYTTAIQVVNPLTLQSNLTVSGTGTSSFGGKIRSSAATATGYNQLYDTTGITTGRGAFAITSTGAGLAFGIEASVGGTSFTGSTAYASYFGTTTATPIHFVTNSAISATLTSGGNVLIGTTTDSANGKLQLATHTSYTGGIGFGTDISLYRKSPYVFGMSGVSDLFLESTGAGLWLGSGAGTYQVGIIRNGSDLKFWTGSNTLALTLDSSQQALFASKIVSSSNVAIGASVNDNSTTLVQAGLSTGVNSKILLKDSWNGSNNNNAYFAVQLGDGSTTSDALRIDYQKNATFAGKVAASVASGGTTALYGKATITSTSADNAIVWLGIGDQNSATRAGLVAYQSWNGTYTDYLAKITVLQGGVGGIDALTFGNTGNATFAGNIKTAAPSGGTAATWRLGTVASVSPTSPNRTIEVEIGGTTYYLHAKTTNN